MPGYDRIFPVPKGHTQYLFVVVGGDLEERSYFQTAASLEEITKLAFISVRHVEELVEIMDCDSGEIFPLHTTNPNGIKVGGLTVPARLLCTKCVKEHGIPSVNTKAICVCCKKCAEIFQNLLCEKCWLAFNPPIA